MIIMNYALKELCLEVTNLCPMECKHCSSCSVKVGKGSFRHMPFPVAKKVIQDFASLGGKILEISGGEPLIYPDLHELCHFAVDQELEIRIYTSGAFMGDDLKLHGVGFSELSLLHEIGVSKIIFNLQGATPKTHEKIMGVTGTHDIVLRGIKNAKNLGFWVGVHFVPMRPNYWELPDLCELGLKLGLDEIALLRFVPQGRGKQNQTWLDLNCADFKELLLMVLSLMDKYPTLNLRAGCPLDFLSLYKKDIKPHPCKAGRSTCAIAPTGEVLPCPGFKNSHDFEAGNVYKEDLNLIWPKGFQALRDFDHTQISGPCQTCDFLNKCRGRCAAQRHIINGDIYKGPDPACPKVERVPRTNNLKIQPLKMAANLDY